MVIRFSICDCSLFLEDLNVNSHFMEKPLSVSSPSVEKKMTTIFIITIVIHYHCKYMIFGRDDQFSKVHDISMPSCICVSVYTLYYSPIGATLTNRCVSCMTACTYCMDSLSLRVGSLPVPITEWTSSLSFFCTSSCFVSKRTNQINIVAVLSKPAANTLVATPA